ncbi:MAG: altronate dehydratase family protein [Alphaproteobacteria bacterium]|nr:altronate dehydratase family protein [Alphaproteobacteria bacterium]MBU1515190.1 altronate dehydratase family protein [Alphaproteobacteria bacterium]MBU2092320.1 altronate dehydratase family protein [Alphaproteobacteria bacterium]MBU2152914.1 altronate dehydratase family protein [Alphaproteobacteria bacterium]MBU2305745.1 altronate dehydratase family protein [Alphaproteobacteria bacterium]
MPARHLRLHDLDNVVTALSALAPGDEIEGVTVRAPIPAGHKLAVRALRAGEPVVKYANTIAVATQVIAAGEHVHVHNAAMPDVLGPRHAVRAARDVMYPVDPRTFLGIQRADGRVATRNFVGVITTVNCSATVARAIADRFRGEALDRWPGVDGVVALTHAYGCAMGRDSEGIRTLRRTLAGYARHPNFAGVLLLGLGCESNELSALVEACKGVSNLRTMDIQSIGGTVETIAAGSRAVTELLEGAAGVRRTPQPIAHLSLGLQCGGSDAFSGATANPALGAAADLLVAHGATVILSETPEIYGAEHLLKSRAASPEAADALDRRIAWWTDHASTGGGTLNDNPSAGNIAGGITTILEKSLGAVAKGGSSPLNAVIEYAEPLPSRGLVFMDSPGYDPMSATGQVASGANLIAFTTGRGSTFGCKPAPSLKLSTNSDLYRRMRDDIDVNCGDILEAGVGVAEKGCEVFEALIAMAGGQPSASERHGFGDAEFTPWVPGVIT